MDSEMVKEITEGKVTRPRPKHLFLFLQPNNPTGVARWVKHFAYDIVKEVVNYGTLIKYNVYWLTSLRLHPVVLLYFAFLS